MIKIAIVYSSRTGNTKALMKYLYDRLLLHFHNITFYDVEQFPLTQLAEHDGLIIGTYTWGDGEIPTEMLSIYTAFEKQSVNHIITGVVGTGDRFYPHFCGAVDEFRDMLYVKTKLAVTLKVELFPQSSDYERCNKFVELFAECLTRKISV